MEGVGSTPMCQGSAPEASSAAGQHWLILGVCTVAVVLSFLLEVRPDQRVAVRGLPQFPLPESCFSRGVLGVSCPGCGLTRSFIHLAHGNWQASWRIHHVGWLMAAAVLFQFPYRLYLLARREPVRPRLGRFVGVLGCLLIVLLVANWPLALLEERRAAATKVEVREPRATGGRVSLSE